MKLRSTRLYLSQLLTRSVAAPLTLGVSALLASSCASDEAKELTFISQRVPAIASMLEGARTSAPERADDGRLVVRSFRGEASPESAWKDAARTVTVEVDATGAMRVGSLRQPFELGVTRLGSRTAGDIEGSAVVRRDEDGRVHSILLSRPYGVEDLLVQNEARTAVGYDVDLPAGWSMTRPAGDVGLVEIRDGRGRPRMRLVADAAWDARGKRFPVVAALDGKRISFSVAKDAELPVVIDPEWQDTSSPARVRARSTATVLQDGKVLVIGGISDSDDIVSDSAEVFCSTEIYDPLDLSWEAGPSIPGPNGEGCTPLMDHVAVPLPDGSVLVAGGANRDARIGADQPAALSRAWRFDPRTRTFTETGAMSAPRVHHTGTLMASGRVLIAGGSDRLTPLHESRAFCPDVGDQRCQRCVGQDSADVYDPEAGVFTHVDMPRARACHTATLLSDDSVLLVGGGGAPLDLGIGQTGEPVSALSLFKGGAFVELPTQLNSPRYGHVAVQRPDTNQILVAFGRDEVAMVAPPKEGEVLAEVLDVDAILSSNPPAFAQPLPCRPADDEGQSGGGGGGGGGASGEGGDGDDGGDPVCPVPRSYASAVLSRNGTALIAGGQESEIGGTKASIAVDEFDFDTLRFVSPQPAQLPSPASKPVLTLLPTGKILLVGRTAPAELIDDTDWHFEAGDTDDLPELSQSRAWQTATPLPDGRILIAGGYADVGAVGPDASRDSAELFDPATMTSTPIATPMTSRRLAHTATLLPAQGDHGPRVLLVGGMSAWKTTDQAGDVATETAELFDIDTETFIPTGSMSTKRASHAAVRLSTGQVLVTGGLGDVRDANRNFVLPPSAELYDPTTGTFVPVGAPALGRINHTATLLPSGNVLVAGGYAEFGQLNEPAEVLGSAEIFDYATQTFRSIPGLVIPRGLATATTLPDGQVLFAGGSEISSTAEMFDPESETFRTTQGAMLSRRVAAAAVMLPSGKVLIAGGAEELRAFEPRADVELFDPATESFESLEGESVPRWDHEAVLLVDGRVALFGGEVDAGSSDTTASVTLLTAAPTVAGEAAELLSGPSRVAPGAAYSVGGSSLTSYWETSSGPYASPTGAPIAVWVPLAGAPVLGTFAPWAAGSATWVPPSTPYAGPGFLFAARHGQSSVGLSVEVGLAPQGVPCTADAACDSGFCSDGVCCDERCHVGGDDERACRACSVAMGAAQDGTCSNVAEDTDPHEDCTQAPECAAKFAVCGGDGECKECRCASKLDCADGYTCTASGHCEAPLEQGEDGGCAIDAAPGSRGTASLWAVAIAVLGGALRLRRRQVVVAGRRTRRLSAPMKRVDTCTYADVVAHGDAHHATPCARTVALVRSASPATPRHT